MSPGMQDKLAKDAVGGALRSGIAHSLETLKSACASTRPTRARLRLDRRIG